MSCASPPKLGVKPPGEPLVERKAVRIRRDRRERAAVGDVADDRHRRAAAGAGHPRLGPQPVAHQQRAAAVRAEDTAPRIRVAEEEAAGDALARIVRVRVCLHDGAPRIADVAKQLQVVVDLRRAPDVAPSLHRHYSDFITTTSDSVPVPRIGTQVLVGSPLERLPSHRDDWFPQFHREAWTRLTPPARRTPPGQPSGQPPDFSRRSHPPSVSMSCPGSRRGNGGSLAFVFPPGCPVRC